MECPWCKGWMMVGRTCKRCEIITRTAFRVNLREARLRAEMSQGDLAKKGGFHPSSISSFERGRRTPTIISLKRLARALGVTADYLIGKE